MMGEIRVDEGGGEGCNDGAPRFTVHWSGVPMAHEVDARFELDASWRRPRDTFGPFELIRCFVGSLLRLRPEKVVFLQFSGIALELARISAALGLEVHLRMPAEDALEGLDPVSARWAAGVLSRVHGMVEGGALLAPEAMRARFGGQWAEAWSDGGVGDRDRPAFGYEAYALGRRDHALLYAMQLGFASHFSGCRKVLDVGCGTGVFLEVLSRNGITATGVERNDVSARFAQCMGHQVVQADAIEYLEANPASCDGVYCSHFIEHLPIEAAERLIRAVSAALVPGGVAVFVFPDPESIRSQLLGFWRDPEHVRFYHPELVSTLAEIHGLALEFDSQLESGREVVPFAMKMPPRPVASAPGLWARVLRRLGIAPFSLLEAERMRADAMDEVLKQLWSVNQTWAWDDNAVLRFRKRAALI